MNSLLCGCSHSNCWQLFTIFDEGYPKNQIQSFFALPWTKPCAYHHNFHDEFRCCRDYWKKTFHFHLVVVSLFSCSVLLPLFNISIFFVWMLDMRGGEAKSSEIYSLASAAGAASASTNAIAMYVRICACCDLCIFSFIHSFYFCFNCCAATVTVAAASKVKSTTMASKAKCVRFINIHLYLPFLV